jgi:lysophospholipase L1-like esterase
MKNILCFGDSNTWGYTPLSGARYSITERWPRVLQAKLGDKYHIIEEGLCGRTIATNIQDRPQRSGQELLPALLESHRPLDLVIVMLGTNDLQHCFNLSAEDIARNIKSFCLMIKNNEFISPHKPEIKILLISPAHLADLPIEDQQHFQDGQLKSKQLAQYYSQVATDLRIEFLDAHRFVQTTNIDGIHWTKEQHNKFGGILSTTIKQILTID